jgi:hypothetical protein
MSTAAILLLILILFVVLPVGLVLAKSWWAPKPGSGSCCCGTGANAGKKQEPKSGSCAAGYKLVHGGCASISCA